MTKLLTELPDNGDAGAGSLRGSLALSLASLAGILDLMSRISPEPLAADYRRQSITALMRAIDIIHGLGREGFTLIGTFLGVRRHKIGQQSSFIIIPN